MSDTNQQLDAVDQMQESLQEKDELIEALTLRLERTVEELDRMSRSGGRAGKSTNGLPSELVEQQSMLAQQLEEAVESWHAAQPVEQLSRIEDGIQQILSSFGSGEIQPTSVASPAPSSPAAKTSASAAKPESDSEDFWAATKARLMGAQTVETSGASTNETKPVTEFPAPPQVVEPVAVESMTTEVVRFDPGNAPEAPVPIANDADQESLHAAIEQRNEYIAYLTSRLRNEQERNVGKIDWKALAERPSELGEQLREMESMLKDQLKQAEITQSLERASIARQRAKLSQVKHHLEQEIKRMGFSNGSLSEESAAEKTENRWSKLFSREK